MKIIEILFLTIETLDLKERIIIKQAKKQEMSIFLRIKRCFKEISLKK
jgi:hypothetical protein